MSKFISATSNGDAREIACFGTRGDGKTIGALMAMVEHALRHQAAGYPLPVCWIGVTDTFQSHKLKTIRSLENPLWKGLWETSEQGHVAQFIVDGCSHVKLDLFGIEDKGAMDRVRMETCGVWFEEPAPTALLVQSSGVDETAWTTAITSQRIPSHCHPAIMTLNYPDEDHWTAQRFVFHPQPGTMYFRVPPGERATAEDRAEWSKALAGRPDMERRLLSGEFGTIMLGQQIAIGFNQDLHVATGLKPIKGEPLFIGQDGGHTPCTVIGQAWRGRVFVYAALSIDRGGMRQQYETNVKPWLAQHAPWAIKDDSMLRGVYDPAMPDDESDSDRNPIDVCNELVGGSWEPGPVAWESRKNALITAINKHSGPGELALSLDQVGAKQLIQALSGRWYYPQNRLGGVSRDAPLKPNHPWEDLGDAFCYFLCAAMPEVNKVPRPPLVTYSSFDPRQLQRRPIQNDLSTKSEFDPRRRAQ